MVRKFLSAKLVSLIATKSSAYATLPAERQVAIVSNDKPEAIILFIFIFFIIIYLSFYLWIVTGIFAVTVEPSAFVTVQLIFVVLTALPLPRVVRSTIPLLSTVM